MPFLAHYDSCPNKELKRKLERERERERERKKLKFSLRVYCFLASAIKMKEKLFLCFDVQTFMSRSWSVIREK